MPNNLSQHLPPGWTGSINDAINLLIKMGKFKGPWDGRVYIDSTIRKYDDVVYGAFFRKSFYQLKLEKELFDLRRAEEKNVKDAYKSEADLLVERRIQIDDAYEKASESNNRHGAIYGYANSLASMALKACHTSHLEIIRMVHDKGGADTWELFSYCLPLYVAINNFQPLIVEYLINNGIDYKNGTELDMPAFEQIFRLTPDTTAIKQMHDIMAARLLDDLARTPLSDSFEWMVLAILLKPELMDAPIPKHPSITPRIFFESTDKTEVLKLIAESALAKITFDRAAYVVELDRRSNAAITAHDEGWRKIHQENENKIDAAFINMSEEIDTQEQNLDLELKQQITHIKEHYAKAEKQAIDAYKAWVSERNEAERTADRKKTQGIIKSMVGVIVSAIVAPFVAPKIVSALSVPKTLAPFATNALSGAIGSATSAAITRTNIGNATFKGLLSAGLTHGLERGLIKLEFIKQLPTAGLPTDKLLKFAEIAANSAIKTTIYGGKFGSNCAATVASKLVGEKISPEAEAHAKAFVEAFDIAGAAFIRECTITGVAAAVRGDRLSEGFVEALNAGLSGATKTVVANSDTKIKESAPEIVKRSAIARKLVNKNPLVTDNSKADISEVLEAGPITPIHKPDSDSLAGISVLACLGLRRSRENEYEDNEAEVTQSKSSEKEFDAAKTARGLQLVATEPNKYRVPLVKLASDRTEYVTKLRDIERVNSRSNIMPSFMFQENAIKGSSNKTSSTILSIKSREHFKLKSQLPETHINSGMRHVFAFGRGIEYGRDNVADMVLHLDETAIDTVILAWDIVNAIGFLSIGFATAGSMRRNRSRTDAITNIVSAFKIADSVKRTEMLAEFSTSLIFIRALGNLPKATVTKAMEAKGLAIPTRHGWAYQEFSKSALVLHKQTTEGGLIWRIVSKRNNIHKAHGRNPQFWAVITEPTKFITTDPTYAMRNAMPVKNAIAANGLQIGQAIPGKAFITRKIKALGPNPGGGYEIVCTPGAVLFSQMPASLPRQIVGNRTKIQQFLSNATTVLTNEANLFPVFALDAELNKKREEIKNSKVAKPNIGS